jgi:hypothetical protein
MGVDWIPCRVETGCSNEELCEIVRREAIHFRTGGFSMASGLDPRIQFLEAEREAIRQSYLELGPLHRRLLFKRDSHRVSVISSEVLFPIEWRVDAERSILPWELSDLLAKWQSYREEVRLGGHRPFLQQLYIYASLHDLVTIDLANLLSVVPHSLTVAGSWANRPEVVACRDAILAAPLLTLPLPPQWPTGGGDTDLTAVERGFAKVESSVSAWNNAARRGNVRLRLPRRPLPFEEWIAARLNDGWFSSFLTWAEPWKCGGYGLYRDCE